MKEPQLALFPNSANKKICADRLRLLKEEYNKAQASRNQKGMVHAMREAGEVLQQFERQLK